MQGIDLTMPPGLGVDARGNFLMSRFGMAFRRWCKQQRIETPPATWNLHLIGRGESDSKNAYPVLDSNVKASHTKPILFFLSTMATEIHGLCGCIFSTNDTIGYVLFCGDVCLQGRAGPFPIH